MILVIRLVDYRDPSYLIGLSSWLCVFWYLTSCMVQLLSVNVTVGFEDLVVSPSCAITAFKWENSRIACQ